MWFDICTREGQKAGRINADNVETVNIHPEQAGDIVQVDVTIGGTKTVHYMNISEAQRLNQFLER